MNLFELQFGECDCGKKDQPLVYRETVLGGKLQMRPHCPECLNLWVEENQDSEEAIVITEAGLAPLLTSMNN